MTVASGGLFQEEFTVIADNEGSQMGVVNICHL